MKSESTKKPIINKTIPSNSNMTELKKKLEEIKEYYNKLKNLYTIKDDIEELKDGRTGISRLLKDHLDDNQNKYDNLQRVIQKKESIINNYLESLQNASSLYEELNTVVAGTDQTKYQRVLQIITEENIELIDKRVDEINTGWNSIFDVSDKNINVIEEILDIHKEIKETYDNLFLHKDSEQSKVDELHQFIEEIKKEHELIVLGYSKEVEENGIMVTKSYKSYAKLIKESHNESQSIIDELKTFHSKIFGTLNNENNSLKKELEDQQEKLKSIENEAKNILQLSSIAGLAGGFAKRKGEAKKSKISSTILFFISLLLLTGLNAYFISTIDDIFNDLGTLLFKTIYTLPAVWMAVVFNINMNKYSKLEEEYAHKESLAKSFEKYKSEINRLKTDDSKLDSDKLLYKLMETNIEAFKVNPAETMYQHDYRDDN